MGEVSSGDMKKFCDSVVEWCEQYRREVQPGPIKFAYISRRWSFYPRKFGLRLIDVLHADGRFVTQMVAGGGISVVLRNMEQAELLRRLMAEDEASEV